MELNGESKMLRVFLGEIDKIGHTTLYESILLAARKHGIAGCTVSRGIMSYGASTRIHSSKLLEISEDLPVIVEMVDSAENISNFLPVVNQLFEECGRGGLVTIESVEVLYYKAKK